MNARVAELQGEITRLSAQLVAELAGAMVAEDEPPAPPAPLWLSIPDFAARLRIDRRTVYRMIEDGLPHERVRPRAVRIPVARAEAWISTSGAAEQPAGLDVAGEDMP